MKEIKLTQGKVALVDNEDFEKVNQYKWCAHYTRGNWYAERHMTTIKGKRPIQRMHRIITDCPKELQVDHINHNGLDNRKSNLRICTKSENHMNQRIRKNTSSKYKGVYWDKHVKKWGAKIRLNGKLIHLGIYINEITAALAYNIKAKELFGEFAYLNFQSVIMTIDPAIHGSCYDNFSKQLHGNLKEKK